MDWWKDIRMCGTSIVWASSLSDRQTGLEFSSCRKFDKWIRELKRCSTSQVSRFFVMAQTTLCCWLESFVSTAVHLFIVCLYILSPTCPWKSRKRNTWLHKKKSRIIESNQASDQTTDQPSSQANWLGNWILGERERVKKKTKRASERDSKR